MSAAIAIELCPNNSDTTFKGTPAAQFVKATVEDMPAAVALAAAVFGGLNTIPVEKRVEWLQKNPDIDYLLKLDDQKAPALHDFLIDMEQSGLPFILG